MRRRGLGALATAAVALALVPSARPAGAAPTAIAVGWWSTAPALTYSDVPDGGFVAQGGPSTPAAYAAVAFQLGVDDEVDGLRLLIAPGSLSVPTSPLAACPLVEGFTPVAGGPIADAPDYDCGAGVPGTTGEDGSAHEFDLTDLPDRDGAALALAIVPLGPTARVAFEAPGIDALSLVPSPAGAGGGATDDPASTPTTQAPIAAGTGTGTGAPPAPATGRTAPSRPAAGPATTAVTSPPTTTVSARPTAATSATPVASAGATSSGSGGSPLLLLLFVGLVVLTVLLWSGASAPARGRWRPAQ